MIVSLVKIGTKENIKDSYENEYLYFNTVEYFRSLEKDPLGRNDPHEGDLKLEQGAKLTVELDGKKYQFHEIFKNFSAQYHEFLLKTPGNICSFCRFDIEEDGKYFSIDERLKSFGDTALIIYKLNQFVKSIDKSIKQLGFPLERKHVEYYEPKSYNGDLSFFHKDIFFQYQNEYRILIKSSGENAIKVKVPNLKKFSIMVDFRNLKSLFFKFNK